MYVTPEVKLLVIEKLKAVIKMAEAHYGKALPFPNVVYQLRGTTAGTATFRTWTVDFNAALLMQNIEDFIARTVPHEMAHLACDKIYPEAHQRQYTGYGRFTKRQPHGAQWQEIMRVMGVRDITRCHSYDTSTTKVVKSSSRIHPWACPCGKEFTLSAKMTNQLRVSPGSRWHCKGRRLFEVNATPVPAVTPAPIVRTPVVIPEQFVTRASSYAIAAQTADKRATEAPGSKLDKCANLYVSYQHLGRQMVIAMFVQEAGCTPAGAATYYSTMKKRYA